MVKTIQDELREHHEAAVALIAKARTEDRDLTAEEQKTYEEHRGAMEALAAKRKRQDGLDAMLASLGTLPAASAANGHVKVEPLTAMTIRSSPMGGVLPLIQAMRQPGLGQAFIDSDVFKLMQSMPRAGTWQTPTFEIDAAVTITPTSVIPPGTIVVPPPPVYPWDLVSSRFAQGTTEAGSIPYLVETSFTNAASYVAVGGVKPESAKVFTLASATLLKLAHIINVPDEFLDDVAGMRSFIDQNMAGGLIEKLEVEVVNGAGGAGKIQGLLTLPGKQADYVPATSGTPAVKVDPLAVSIAKASAAIWTASKYRPDTVVVSPTSFLDVGLQTSDKFFLFPPGTPLGGLTPVQSPQVPDGTAIIGAFQRASMLFRKGGIQIQATNSHDANFASNITTIRAEMRVAVVHFVPGAYGLVTSLTLP